MQSSNFNQQWMLWLWGEIGKSPLVKNSMSSLILLGLEELLKLKLLILSVHVIRKLMQWFLCHSCSHGLHTDADYRRM